MEGIEWDHSIYPYDSLALRPINLKKCHDGAWIEMKMRW